MDHLITEKLHVRYLNGSTSDGPSYPRCYTLTHSDSTGDLYLTIGPIYDLKQIAGWYTRFMRDEVLAAWEKNGQEMVLHVDIHVSGGLILGSAKWQDKIFCQHMPLVLEALRYGDREWIENHPELDQAPIKIHFHATHPNYDRVESWGILHDYK